jgi:hypothetical protein
VVISNWEENHRLIASLRDEPVKTEELSGREYLDVALFWRPQWSNGYNSQRNLEAITPDQADQRGRLYLANEDSAAVLALDGGRARALGPDGVDVLTQHGVPVKAQRRSRSAMWLVAGIGSILLAGFIALMFRKRGRSGLWVEKGFHKS